MYADAVWVRRIRFTVSANPTAIYQQQPKMSPLTGLPVYHFSVMFSFPYKSSNKQNSVFHSNWWQLSPRKCVCQLLFNKRYERFNGTGNDWVRIQSCFVRVTLMIYSKNNVISPDVFWSCLHVHWHRRATAQTVSLHNKLYLLLSLT